MVAARQLAVLLAAFWLAGCGDGGVPDAKKAEEELRRLYDEARRVAPDDPVEWAKEDLKRFGDWEYRIVELPPAVDHEAELNTLGEDRWEAFWVRPGPDGSLTVYLKRPARSYLRAVPVGGLRGLFSGDEGGSSGGE